MILKTTKLEVDSIKYACGLSDALCTVFTIETNSDIVQLEITGLNGEELKPEYSWYIGRMAERKFNHDLDKRVESVTHN